MHQLTSREPMQLLAYARKIEVKAFPSGGSMGVDGTTHELELIAGFNRSTFRWWLKAPVGWEPLTEIAAELMAIAQPYRRRYL